MNEQQEKLLLEIVSSLDYGAVSGYWPEEVCRYCYGESTGYSDSQDFKHQPDCVVLKIQKLRELSTKEDY